MRLFKHYALQVGNSGVVERLAQNVSNSQLSSYDEEKGVFMRIGLFVFLMTFLGTASAVEFNYLKPEEQKYFKNDSMDGKNQQERIDMNVREINRLYGEVSMLKAEVQRLRAEMDQLKKGK